MNVKHKWLLTQIIDGLFNAHGGITEQKHKELLEQLDEVVGTEL